MEPLKQVQVEGQLMFAEPQDLFGNLDEVCSVKTFSCSSYNNSSLFSDSVSGPGTAIGQVCVCLCALRIRFEENHLQTIGYIESLD